MTNYIHNYIQRPFFWLKKWRKPLIYKDFRSGAGNRTWTCKYVRTHEPESCASANSAIPAFWWAGVDSNHRSLWRQIYSLLPLATREPTHAIDCQGTSPVLGEKSWWRDLNPQPADYKSAALPIELHQHHPNGRENGDPEGARTLDLQRDRLAF